MTRRARLDADRLEREHQREVGGWRGLVVQLRGGAERTLLGQDDEDAENMARALHAADRPGFAAFVHTRRCRRRDQTCTCAGVRLVSGARA